LRAWLFHGVSRASQRLATDRLIAPSPLALLRDVNAAIRRLTIESDRRHD